jgi:hypothetical protein
VHGPRPGDLRRAALVAHAAADPGRGRLRRPAVRRGRRRAGHRARLREPFFRLVSGGKGVPGATRAANAGGRRLTDVADSDRVREAHLSGATLVLNALHRTHPPLVRFCAELAGELGHPTQCNAYVTPGGGAQGFAYHHDTHDVLVLQVAGRKHWRVFAPVVELPLPSLKRAGDDLVGPDDVPLLDVVLEAGDALYLRAATCTPPPRPRTRRCT